MNQVGLNPFEENDVDEGHDSLPALYVNSEDLTCNIKSSSTVNIESTISIDNMAARLINDRFILTALEFHLELMEMGHELPRFRDFFSNPANFERGRIVDTSYSHNKLTRTSSIQTFDSLDFARYSDDGERHENDRIAVLEFELRKAHEKINSLRSLLTKTAETDFVVTSLEPVAHSGIKSDETLLSYEKRALNFLINEYLLKHGYKLTSVTFSEENDSQDFDDWDDVGINISKPPNLMKLFRDYGQHVSPAVQKQDFECMTSLGTEDICEVFETQSELNFLNKKLALLENSLELKMKENNELKLHLEDLKVSVSNNLSNEAISMSSQDLRKDANDICIAELHHRSEDELTQSQHSSVTSSTENLTQTNPSKEVVFTSFQEALFKIIIKNNHSMFGKSSEAGPILNSLATVVNILGDTLPRIVPNILLAKRDELIPILINAATLHPNMIKRDELLSLIFNLIKRPNADQRQAIMRGCVAFARYVGPLQTEAELLPQCWEQISHKYPERRLLVAETCGFLSPYVFDAIRSSLLLSMLVQMSEDREEDVREAVARSLGVLVSFLEHDDKYNQTLNLLSKFLLDPSEKVVLATKMILLPSVARWSMQLKCLETFLNHAIIEPIENSIYLASPNSSYSHYAVKDHKLFISNMSTLESLLPYIFSHVINSCFDYNSKENNNLSCASEQDCSFFNLMDPCVDMEPLNDISIILSKDKSEIFVKNFFNTVSQEWFAMWNEYNWLSSDLIHRLVELSNKLEVSQPSLHSLVIFFRKLCSLFGKHLMLSLVKPKFEKLITIPRDENSLDRAVMNGLSNLNRSIVPVFIAGVYPAMLNNADLSIKFSENYEALFKLLCELLSSLAVHQSPLISLQAAFTELCSQGSTENFNPRELLLQVLWKFGIIHKNLLVRMATSQMFECLVLTCKLSETTISSKVIPALVTLSSDTEESVRVSTISPFGAILEYLSTHFDVNDLSIANIIDKVQLQLQVFMEDHQITEARSKDKSNLSINSQLSSNAGNASILEIIKVLGRLGPKVDSKFRDEFVLPRLTALAVRNQLSLNVNSSFKQEVTMRLLDAFINVSCCFLNCQISQEVVLPGLRCLHHDIQTIAPDRANIVASMMKEMEDKIENKSSHAARTPHALSVTKSEECTNNQPQPLHTEMMKHNLLSRIKDVKDRATHGQFTKMFQISKR